jgi:hypothetical protein
MSSSEVPIMPSALRSPTASNARQKRFTQKATLHHVGFRIDHPAQLAIEALQTMLAGQKAGDVCSASMICRRALLVYRDHVSRLKAHDPAMFGKEFNEVRSGTILPYLRHRVGRAAHKPT